MRLFNKLGRYEKIYRSIVAFYFIAITLFVFVRRDLPSHRYFSTKFLNERYDKTIELARIQDKELNEFHVFQEAQQDRFSSAPDKPLRKEPGSSSGGASDCITEIPQNTKALCPFNKNLLISYLHKKFPSANWRPIERVYRLKMNMVWLYRIGDWIIGYTYTLFIYWLLPASAVYLLLKKVVSSRQAHSSS